MPGSEKADPYEHILFVFLFVFAWYCYFHKYVLHIMDKLKYQQHFLKNMKLAFFI